MAMDRFLIAPFNTGMQNNLEPWMIPEDSFEDLTNAYVFRGRIKKRFGSIPIGLTQPLSQVRISVATTSSVMNTTSGTVFGFIFGTGQQFSIGSIIFTVQTTGTPVTMLNTGTNVGTINGSGSGSGTINVSATSFFIGAIGQIFNVGGQTFTVAVPNGALTTSGPGSGTYNIATGAYTFTGCIPNASIFYYPIVGTYNTSSGAFSFSNTQATTPNTNIFFYPQQPIMGLCNYELGPINDQPSIAFDTEFAYFFTPSGGWSRLGTGTTANPLPIWHGNNPNGPNPSTLNFFWTCNWDGTTPNVVTLFVTNFQATLGALNAGNYQYDDPIWFFNATSSSSISTGTWTTLSYSPDPTLNTTSNTQPLTVTQTTSSGTIISNFVQTARIVIPFKNRLLLLNTIENNANGATQFNTASKQATGISNNSNGADNSYATSTNTEYVNRCRFSHNGSPLATNAWLEPNFTYQASVGGPTVIADGGGYIDAPTEEAIVTAEFIKDRLIVFFERSTWELAYTGNEVLPFVWQKINTELGAESQQSSVPFDKVVLTVSNVGVHACNGSNVERIDTKIPDEIFSIEQTGIAEQRVAGIRDYFSETVYWSFPSKEDKSIYPDKVIVYNYQNDSWAINEDCITAFGYYEQQQDLTWENATMTWEQATFNWIDNVQPQSRQVIFGNQQGFVLTAVRDMGRNGASMSITNIVAAAAPRTGVDLTVLNHTLKSADGFGNEYDISGDYILIENCQGFTSLNNQIFPASVVDQNTLNIDDVAIGTAYTGAGTISRVSNLRIKSKEFNPYINKGQNVYVAKIDFGVTKTTSGEVLVDYYTSSSELSTLQEGVDSEAIMGDGILETSPYSASLAPLEQVQRLLWHPIYFQSEGEFIQIYITMDGNQMETPSIALSDFELQGMVLHTMPISTRLQ